MNECLASGLTNFIPKRTHSVSLQALVRASIERGKVKSVSASKGKLVAFFMRAPHLGGDSEVETLSGTHTFHASIHPLLPLTLRIALKWS